MLFAVGRLKFRYQVGFFKVLSDLLHDNTFKNLRYKCHVRDESVVLWFIWIGNLFLRNWRDDGCLLCTRNAAFLYRSVAHDTDEQENINHFKKNGSWQWVKCTGFSR